MKEKECQIDKLNKEKNKIAFQVKNIVKMKEKN